jgi:predicted ATPase
MLTTVAIRGYRSLREIVLPLAQLTVVTGANGTGKSSLYRALRLLADCGRGEVIGSLAREGGLESVLWAGPEELGRARRTGKVEPTLRAKPVSLELGFASDDSAIWSISDCRRWQDTTRCSRAIRRSNVRRCSWAG